LDQGYTPDYVSDRQLAQARTDAKGLLTLPGGSYRVVLVPPCRFMPLETLQHLAALSQNGATILFQNGFPTDVPGWGGLAVRRERFHSLIASLQRTPLDAHASIPGKTRRFRVGNGEIRIGDDLPSLLENSHVLQEKSVVAAALTYIRRKDQDGTFYFIVNQGKSAVDQWVPFGTRMKNVVLMDPMTGKVGRAAVRSTSQHASEAYLQLAPGESVFLRSILHQDKVIPAWNYWQSIGPTQELSGNWQVTFLEGGPEIPPAYQTPILGSWTTQGGEQAERFAGTARYTLHFTLPEGIKHASINLGKVGQSARVRLNGKPYGTLLAAPFQVHADNPKLGDNLLEVEVTSVAANRIRDLDRRGVVWKIFKDINFVNLDYKPFNAADWPLTDCGLLGPVTLQPLEPKLLSPGDRAE